MNDLLNTRPAMAANPAAIEPISAEVLDKTQAAFIAAFERELANCGAAATPQLAMRAAAAACRQLLADRWALTQAQDAVRGAALCLAVRGGALCLDVCMVVLNVEVYQMPAHRISM